MRLLVIGGTRFVGRHIVEAALAAGHEVALFHRGQTGVGLFPQAEHLLGDRNSDLSALTGQHFDATIDCCGFFPRHVNTLADHLGGGGHRGHGGQYVFISSVSAYALPDAPGFTEDSPLVELDDPTVEEITNDTYGGLKVLCERAALDRFGSDTLIVRPTFVVGPHDYSWRFPFWVDRIAKGGDVLVPGPPTDPAQVIDARDMASWIIGLVERRHGGVFHAAGPTATHTWLDEMSAIVAAVGPPGTSLVWVEPAFLEANGVDGSSFPLWSGGDSWALIETADPAAALATGLTIRPLADTIRDTLAWTRGHDGPRPGGITAEREAELLSLWRARA